MTERLASILEGIDTGIGNTIKTCGLLSLWAEVVDERVGKHTEAVKIRNRVLYVNTSTSTWANELSFLKNEIIAKFNQASGREVIRDIRFRAGKES